MIRKTEEYHYQQINDSGTNHISRIKETSIPRIEKDYSYTVIKTVTTSTNKGSNSLNTGFQNLLSTKNNKNYKSYSKYSNLSKNKENLKYTCLDGDHGDKNKKNTSRKYAEGKNTTISNINEEAKKRGKNFESRSLNKYSANSTNSISKSRATGGLECTCGKDHNSGNSGVTKISQTKNIKTIFNPSHIFPPFLLQYIFIRMYILICNSFLAKTIHHFIIIVLAHFSPNILSGYIVNSHNYIID